jgi:hypothetical protein
MTDLSPAEWFDQFPSLAVNSEWPADSQWCPRHWAPCPLLGANGIGAATELMSIFINEMSAGGDAAAMNAQMQAMGRLCCTLGDDRMYELWGKWPPSDGQPE